MSGVYLSIDLDFFPFLNSRIVFKNKCRQLINKALSLKVDTLVVDAHHGLIKHVSNSKKYGVDHLINIDYHDDIVALNNININNEEEEGAWVSHISWKRNGTYEWRYPNKTECVELKWGICDRNETSVYNNPSMTGWKIIKKRQGISDLPWDNIKAVGICLSGYWLIRGGIYEYQDQHDRIKKSIGTTLCKLTGQDNLESAFAFAYASYLQQDPYDSSCWGCNNYWQKRLGPYRKAAWNNPKIKFVKDNADFVGRYNKTLNLLNEG